MPNRSTAGVETGRLHPAIRAKVSEIKRSLLVFVGLNRFKKAFLTSQNFCTNAPAVGAQDFFLKRMIFPEAGHALHLCGYKTEVQLRMFRMCVFFELIPMSLEGGRVQFGQFAKGNMKTSAPLILIFLNLVKYLIKNGLNNLQFAHIPLSMIIQQVQEGSLQF